MKDKDKPAKKRTHEPKANKPSRVIRVWRFYEAPSHLRILSQHGGDEDWLAHVPKALADSNIGWISDSRSFGVCDVSEHPMPDGSKVYIGAHA